MKIRPEVYSGMSRIVPLKGCWCCSSVLFPSFFLLYLNSFTVDNLISATVQPDSRNERCWLMCGSGWGVAWRISKAHTFGTWWFILPRAVFLQRALVSSTNYLIVKLIKSRFLMCACMCVHFKWKATQGFHNSSTDLVPIFLG